MGRTREIIICVVISLLCLGVLTVYSANVHHGTETGLVSTVQKEILFAVVSIGMLILGTQLDYHKLGRYSFWFLGVALVLLVAVLMFDKDVNGARRWFRFGPVSFQPSEVAKLCLVIYMAASLTRKQEHIREFFHGFLPPVVVVAMVFGLLILEPDFGTAVLIAITLGAMLFVAGVRVWHGVFISVLAAPAFIYLVVTESYRLRRVLAFMDPSADPQGAGYHLLQSLIALGVGGSLGVGPGASMQKLYYLPASDSDFIFSIIGEEYGFVGCVTVIILFSVFIWQGIRICRQAPDLLGNLLACGIVTQIGLQTVVNIAVATGTMPTKGLPLPFISSGGSSLIITMFSVGLLLNVAGHCRVDQEPEHFGARKVTVTP